MQQFISGPDYRSEVARAAAQFPPGHDEEYLLVYSRTFAYQGKSTRDLAARPFHLPIGFKTSTLTRELAWVRKAVPAVLGNRVKEDWVIGVSSRRTNTRIFRCADPGAFAIARHFLHHTKYAVKHNQTPQEALAAYEKHVRAHWTRNGVDTSGLSLSIISAAYEHADTDDPVTYSKAFAKREGWDVLVP